MNATGAGALALGIDLGTSAVKVVVADAAGAVLGSGSAGFPTHSALPGQAEQDPAHWLAATGEAVVRLHETLGASLPGWRERIGAIGLAGQLPTLVRVRARAGAAVAVGPAITWKDARADEWAAGAIDAAQRRELYERTGMPIDGRYLGPMLRFHRRAPAGTTPADFDTVLSAKDYLCLALTQTVVTDPSTAAGYGAFDLAGGTFSTQLAALWDLPMAWLPELRAAHAMAAPLSSEGARLLGLRPGIAVTVGAADSVAGAYALAGLQEGVVCIAMGSSTIILDALRERRLDPACRYLLTPHVEPGWYGREMDLLATGTGHQWLSNLFGWGAGHLDSLAADVPPGANGLFFAPYLAGGEQGALWNPALRGAVLGLTLQSTARDIARAFLEGVGFEIRRCIEVLAEAGPVSQVVLTGGFVEHPASLQLLADILGRPVRPVQAVSAAAQGAALGAHAMLGSAAPVRAAAAAAVAPGPARQRYEALYAGYRAAVDVPAPSRTT